MTTVLLILLGWILLSCLIGAVILWRNRPPVPPARPRVRAALDDTGDQVDATVFPIRPPVPPDRPAA